MITSPRIIATCAVAITLRYLCFNTTPEMPLLKISLPAPHEVTVLNVSSATTAEQEEVRETLTVKKVFREEDGTEHGGPLLVLLQGSKGMETVCALEVTGCDLVPTEESLKNISYVEKITDEDGDTHYRFIREYKPAKKTSYQGPLVTEITGNDLLFRRSIRSF